MNLKRSTICRVSRKWHLTTATQGILRANFVLVSIMIFTVLIRIISFRFLHLNYLTRDPDMWLIYELADGKLLQGYTSLWHYFGLSAYSYPILFHSLAATLHTVFDIKFSELFWLNVLFAPVPPLAVYLTAKRYYGRNIALLSSFALATAPVYLFETLPGTFKARALFYAIISIEIYFGTRALEKPKKYLPLVVILAFLSLLTYRAAFPMNILVLSCLVASFAIKKTSPFMRVLGALVAVLASVLFVLGYFTYTPSYGIIETIMSAAGKEGPLILVGIFGIASSLRKRDELSFFPSLPATVFCLVALLNWKAADALPILLSLYSGTGMIKLRDVLFRTKIRWKPFALAVLIVGILTTSFGLWYYPNRWYIQADPRIFDEMAEIRQFTSAQPIQKGSLIYGTTYTGFSFSGAYSSLYFIGSEQETFVKAYALNHLVTTEFDPWLVRHPESIYDYTLQLHNSLPVQNGQTFEQFCNQYCVQYFVAERQASIDEWARVNHGLLAEAYSTGHYRVYEVTSTKPNIELLSFIQSRVPQNATILAPYYMDPLISELRRTFLKNELNTITKFDYFHLLEERFLKKMDTKSEITDLKIKTEMLREAYSDASNLYKFAIQNRFSYIVVDSETSSKGLIAMGLQDIFSEKGLHIFRASEVSSETESGEISQTNNHVLVTNVFIAPAFSPERYFLSGPAQNASVVVAGQGDNISFARTDSTGTASFATKEGEYSIEVEWEGYRVIYPITAVGPYTFLPVLLHPRLEEPMGSYMPVIMSIAVVVFTLLACFMVSGGKEKPV